MTSEKEQNIVRLNEFDVRDWFLGKASPEVAKAIEDDLANHGPISQKLARKREEGEPLAWQDRVVAADLERMKHEDPSPGPKDGPKADRGEGYRR